MQHVVDIPGDLAEFYVDNRVAAGFALAERLPSPARHQPDGTVRGGAPAVRTGSVVDARVKLRTFWWAPHRFRTSGD